MDRQATNAQEAQTPTASSTTAPLDVLILAAGLGTRMRSRDAEVRFKRIVEQKDATAEEKQINEINAGIYCFETRALFAALARVQPANAQGEYYLTDVPGILRADGADVSVFIHTDAREVSG